jgi:2-polyprenyl-3-methyl-5-hydroxy-6-metoxy-1,4-benzoquinol methylase
LLAAADSPPNGRSTREFLQVIKTRVQSLSNWQQQGNETVAAIRTGGIDPDAIKSHIRLEASAYDHFYSGQSKEAARRSAAGRAAARPDEPTGDHVPFRLPPNVNHVFRSTHAVALVETIFGLIKRLYEGEERIRWMDIGCGTGLFANSVNPRRFGVEKWDIVGCDFQEGKIALANQRRARGRSFFCDDALKVLEEYQKRNEPFDLVTMFEFLEHLDDPLRFINQLRLLKPKLVVAGSPLSQKIGLPKYSRPDRAHMWSFSRRGWEQMFELVGFEVVYTSEVRIGTYLGGCDWLTIVCGPRKLLSATRETLGATPARLAHTLAKRSDGK